MKEEMDWSSLGFGYHKTDYNVRCYYRNGKSVTLLEKLDGGEVTEIDGIEGVFDDEHLSVASTVDVDGAKLGSIVVCASSFSVV